MDWELLLILLPFGIIAYWAGFVATKRYKQNKHKFKDEDNYV